jgi:hypothetical protein
MNQFANNLKAQLASQPPPAAASASTPAPTPAPPPPAAKPISGFSLMAKVLWDSIVRLFSRRSN